MCDEFCVIILLEVALDIVIDSKNLLNKSTLCLEWLFQKTKLTFMITKLHQLLFYNVRNYRSVSNYVSHPVGSLLLLHFTTSRSIAFLSSFQNWISESKSCFYFKVYWWQNLRWIEKERNKEKGKMFEKLNKWFCHSLNHNFPMGSIFAWLKKRISILNLGPLYFLLLPHDFLVSLWQSIKETHIIRLYDLATTQSQRGWY